LFVYNSGLIIFLENSLKNILKFKVNFFKFKFIRVDIISKQTPPFKFFNNPNVYAKSTQKIRPKNSKILKRRKTHKTIEKPFKKIFVLKPFLWCISEKMCMHVNKFDKYWTYTNIESFSIDWIESRFTICAVLWNVIGVKFEVWIDFSNHHVPYKVFFLDFSRIIITMLTPLFGILKILCK
jgi:hypothetical protein